MSLGEIARDPVAWAVGVVAALLAVKQALVAAFISATWLNLGQIFTITSITALTIPPHWPPQTQVDWVILVVAGAFAVKVGYGIWKTYDRKL